MMVLSMPDGAVREAGDADVAVAARENANVSNEEFVTHLKERAETRPLCLEEIGFCVIHDEAPDLRGGQHETVEVLIHAAEDLRIGSVFDLFIHGNGRFGSCQLILVTSPVFEVGADRAEHVVSRGKCLSTISRTDNYAFTCRDELYDHILIISVSSHSNEGHVFEFRAIILNSLNMMLLGI